MQRYKKCIQKGVEEPLSRIPFHGDAPLKRLLMCDKNIFPESGTHISVHLIKNLPKKVPGYSKPHKHDCDEINLILSEDGRLVYKIQLGDETYDVVSPSTVLIPKGVKHSAEVVSGNGTFVCIVLNGEYSASE